MKWITTLSLLALLPLASSAMTVTASYVNNTTDNDAATEGDALTSASAIGVAASELTAAGTSTSAQGARFVGANSGCGDASGVREHKTINQSVDITVTWTIVAESWEEYSISLTPEFHAYLNIEDGLGDEPGDTASFNNFATLLSLNGHTLVNTLDLDGGSRSTVGSSNLDDTASQVLSGLSGNNIISLQYSTTATATWDQGAAAGNNRTADAVLWGADGSLDSVTWYTEGFDNYGTDAARDADGIFVDAIVTLDTVPEPATASLMALVGGLGFLIRRHLMS